MLYILPFFLIILLFGCVSSPKEKLPTNSSPSSKSQHCKTVIDSVPTTTTECGNISVTEKVCGMRKLNYTLLEVPKIDLCVDDSSCSGKPITQCASQCSKVMTRCAILIHNTDLKIPGTWMVTANYTIGNYGFQKDPISKYILPNQSFAFDFYQIYQPNPSIGSASCTLYVLSDPLIEDCHEETRPKVECSNVTHITDVEREVCN